MKQVMYNTKLNAHVVRREIEEIKFLELETEEVLETIYETVDQVTQRRLDGLEVVTRTIVGD